MIEKDVLVAGGGTSGFAAAIAAARNGARTLIVERSAGLGGTMTGGLVPGLVSLRHQPWRDQSTLAALESSYEGNQVVRGIAQEYVDRLVAAGAAFGKTGEAPVRVMFDQEVAKTVIDEMVREAGAQILFHSEVCEVEKHGSTVTSARLNWGETVEARVFVDATGDGDVAYLAGAEYALGEPDDSRHLQPISFYFLMGGVDMDKTVAGLEEYAEDYTAGYVETVRRLYGEGKPITVIGFPRMRDRAVENGEYPRAYGSESVKASAHLSIFRPIYRNGKMRYDVTAHNCDMAYKVDATDYVQLSDALSAMRAMAARMAEYYRKYVPGFEDAYLLQVAEQVGIRESRRIMGDHILSGKEALEGRHFEDTVGYCGATVDVHSVQGEEATYMRSIDKGGAYQVPYRILLPLGVEGLLTSGRCVSADRIAIGSIRQQAGCLVTGQAAGTAAALAVERGTTPRKVPVADLQSRLARDGAVL